MKFSFDGDTVDFSGSAAEFVDMAQLFPGQVTTGAKGRGPGKPATRGTAPAGLPAKRVQKALSPEVVQTRKLQGQYLAAIKVLSLPKRAKVKAHLNKTGNKKGAIALARKLGKAA